MSPKLNQLTRFAGSVVRAAIDVAPDEHGLFRLDASMLFAGVKTPVLLVGNAHRNFDDGHALVVLNPADDFGDTLMPGVAYSKAELRYRVGGRCDALLDVAVVGKGEGSVRPVCIYRARKRNKRVQ